MSATQTPAPRGRPRDPRRDEAIYEAAIELLAEAGFEGMTLEALTGSLRQVEEEQLGPDRLVRYVRG